MKDKTASCVISNINEVFSTHGVPKVWVSDDMPFSSNEFKKFARNWNFEIVPSSPEYSRSNEMSKRSVYICKQMLKNVVEII